MIGFVDDTYNTVNDFEGTQQDLPTILSRARKDAQLWNDLLYVSGGALEVSKCKVHVGHYVFARDGAPVLDPLGPVDVAIEVQESGTVGKNIPLQYVPPSTARKTLNLPRDTSKSRYWQYLRMWPQKLLLSQTAA